MCKFEEKMLPRSILFGSITQFQSWIVIPPDSLFLSFKYVLPKFHTLNVNLDNFRNCQVNTFEKIREVIF